MALDETPNCRAILIKESPDRTVYFKTLLRRLLTRLRRVRFEFEPLLTDERFAWFTLRVACITRWTRRAGRRLIADRA